MSIKVLVISNYRETVSVRPEAELVIGLQKAGLDMTVMTFGDAEYVKKFEAAGIRVIDFHPVKKTSRREVRRIRDELVSGQYDILHLFNSQAIINGIRAARGLPVKVVLYRGFAGNVHWYDPTAYFKYLHPRVSKIICNAEASELFLNKQLFFDKRKTVTIPKGHDPAWYENIQAIDRGQLSEVPLESFWVACVANNRPVKGVKYLVQAMYHLPTDAPIELLLIGKDMEAGGIGETIAECPNAHRVHLLGYRKDVLPVVKSSDLLVLPSLNESTPKALIEAMNLGVAPVVTDIPGAGWLVEDGACGFVVPPADPKAISDAILRLFEDRALCQYFGEKAQVHIRKKLNIRDTISGVKKIYQELISE